MQDSGSSQCLFRKQTEGGDMGGILFLAIMKIREILEIDQDLLSRISGIK